MDVAGTPWKRLVHRTFSVFAVAMVSALGALAGAGQASADAGCDELGGNVQSGTICHAHMDTPGYLIDLRYGVDYPDGRPVIDFITKQRDSVVSASQRPNAANLPYLLYITSETFRSAQPLRVVPSLGQQFPGAQSYGEPWQGTESLVLKSVKRVEGELVRSRYKSFTFNHDRNRPVLFDNLFEPGSNPMEAIYPFVAADLEKQEIARGFKLPSDSGRDPSNYQNFAITDDTVIFFFDQGTFGLPADAGDHRSEVPRARIPALQI